MAERQAPNLAHQDLSFHRRGRSTILMVAPFSAVWVTPITSDFQHIDAKTHALRWDKLGCSSQFCERPVCANHGFASEVCRKFPRKISTTETMVDHNQGSEPLRARLMEEILHHLVQTPICISCNHEWYICNYTYMYI